MKLFRRGWIIPVLLLCLMLSVIRIPVHAVESQISLDGNTIYANGVSFRLKKDSNDGLIYIYDLKGENKLLETAVKSPTIYGGSKNKSVTGNIEIIIDSVATGTIHGGGYSDGSGVADVKGNVTIQVIGNTDVTTIYGGGYAYALNGDAQANVTGNVSVVVSAIPSKYHDRITCGGHAVAIGNNQAIAQTGSTSGYITQTTYSIRGGGSATLASEATGYANADVNGDITINADRVDIREVYGAGYASENAQANANNVSVNIYNSSEAMIVEGGGQASGGIANVNQVSVSLRDCINLYGYVYAGGSASSGGSANANTTSLTIQNSIIPAADQWGSIVAAGIYGGGEASGAGSTATVGHVLVNIKDTNTAGTIYSGGKASQSGDATVTSATAYYQNLTGNVFNGGTYYSTLIAGGSGDDATMINVAESQMNVTNCEVAGLWGGGEAGGNPLNTTGTADLILNDETIVQSLANFDTITLNAPLHAQMMMGKTMTEPTTLVIDESTAVGTPLVYCDDTDRMQDTFVLKNGILDYVIEQNQSIWKVGLTTYTISTKASAGGTIVETKTVNKNDCVEIQWKPDNEYEVETVWIDGQIYDLDEHYYTFDTVRADHCVEVVFRKIPGTIKEQVEVDKGENTQLPELNVALNQTLAEELLSNEDKAAVADGKDVEFGVSMKKIIKIPTGIVQGLKTMIDEENVLLNIDLTLFKKVAGIQTELKEIAKPITMTIKVPQEYLDQSNGRPFAVIRSHVNEDGTVATDKLKDLDDHEETVTFETDRFSVYTLVYDVPKKQVTENESTPPEILPPTPNPKPIEVVTENEVIQIPGSVDTGDSVPYEIYIALCVNSIALFSLLLLKAKKYQQ